LRVFLKREGPRLDLTVDCSVWSTPTEPRGCRQTTTLQSPADYSAQTPSQCSQPKSKKATTQRSHYPTDFVSSVAPHPTGPTSRPRTQKTATSTQYEDRHTTKSCNQCAIWIHAQTGSKCQVNTLADRTW